MSYRKLIDLAGEVVHETEKAWLVDFGELKPVWLAKSVVQKNDDGTFTMPEWLAKEKELI